MTLWPSDCLHRRGNHHMMQLSLGFWHFLLLSWSFSVVASLAHAEDRSVHATPLHADTSEPGRANPLDTKEICGVNCLYMFLHFHGCDVGFNQTWQALGMKKQGTSLLDLKHASTKLGLATRAVQCQSPEELSRMPFPLILYCLHPDSHVGHFLLVLRLSEDGEFTALDGTTAKSKTHTIAYLRKHGFWTGYVLVRSKNGEIPIDESLQVSLFGMLAIFVYVSRKRLRINKSKAGLLASAILLGHPSIGATADTLEWRSGNHGPTNALVMLMRLHGRRPSYGAVYSQFQRVSEPTQVSFADIIHVADLFDFPLELIALPPGHLAKAPPGIILLKSAREESGGYYLLIPTTDDPVTVVSGSYVIWSALDRDSFQRDWSGHVLFYAPHAHLNRTIRSAAWAVSVITSVLFILARWKSHSVPSKQSPSRSPA